MMKKRAILLLLLSFFASCTALYASGLSTGFSEVLLEGLETGRVYSTKESVDLPLAVVNTGTEPVDLKIELIMPQAEELKQGFEPIPDPSWIELEKTEFKGIKPNASAITDVRISIPKDEKYKGRKYQIFIWSHTIRKSIGIGLKSKLMFTVSQGQNKK